MAEVAPRIKSSLSLSSSRYEDSITNLSELISTDLNFSRIQEAGLVCLGVLSSLVVQLGLRKLYDPVSPSTIYYTVANLLTFAIPLTFHTRYIWHTSFPIVDKKDPKSYKLTVLATCFFFSLLYAWSDSSTPTAPNFEVTSQRSLIQTFVQVWIFVMLYGGLATSYQYKALWWEETNKNFFFWANATLWLSSLLYQLPLPPAITSLMFLLSAFLSFIVIPYYVFFYHTWKENVQKVRIEKDAVYCFFALYTGLALPFICGTLLHSIRSSGVEEVYVIWIWMLFMTVEYLQFIMTSMRATTSFDYVPFVFSAILTSDFFISTVYMDQDLTSWSFWVLMILDAVLLIIRASGIWFIVARKFRKCRGFGAQVVVNQVAPENVKRSFASALDEDDQDVRRRLKIDTQLASLCVVSEVLGVFAVGCMLVCDYFLNEWGFGVNTISLGLSTAETFKALTALAIVLISKLCALVVSNRINKRRRFQDMMQQASWDMQKKLTENERRQSVQIEMQDFETLAKKFRIDLWKRHFLYLSATAIVVVSFCTWSSIRYIHVSRDEGVIYSFCETRESLNVTEAHWMC